MAHASLLRSNPASFFQSSNSDPAKLSSLGGTPRSSQLTGSTVAGSTPSIRSLSSAHTAMPGHVVPTANIINQKADASRSLYQICVSLKNRLALVPGFEPYLEQLDPNDPVDPLWHLFRSGHPLLAIYNSLQPEVQLKVDDENVSESKKSKMAIFKFVKACMDELKVPSTESFVVTDLMGNDTSGFVKVTQVVNYVLDLAEQRGLLLQLQPYPDDLAADATQNPQMTYRDHIVKELVDTERKYVQDLENLHDLKTSLDHKGAVPGDIIHSIFLNINAILDFQRRFLIRVETTNSMPSNTQKWGAPFVMYEDAFDIYQPFIANQRKAAQVANKVFDKIQQVNHPVATDFNTLDGFLLKPMQRLVKYPLLLKDLHKKTEDEETKMDLSSGWEAAERVLHKANDAVNRDLLEEAVDDLINRVDDWKNHKVDHFGRLLMHGMYGVVTGKTEQEKDVSHQYAVCLFEIQVANYLNQYEIYLFESILLCCKEVSTTKSKDKKDKTKSSGPRPRNKNAKLQLKGRIFMTNVTDVVSLSKPGTGYHSVQIWWKADPGVENFTIRFPNEETMRKWADGLDTQRKENGPRASTSPEAITQDFAWTRDHAGGLENPYINQDDDDDDDYAPGQFMPSHSSSMPRTSSTSSLRQRSATGESTSSLAGMVRAPPPRFPMPGQHAPLSVQTQGAGTESPGPRTGDSYFSPIDGHSPASSRTSTASGMFLPYPVPKSGTPQAVWDEYPRYSGNQGMPRAPSRDGTSPAPHVTNGRNPRGPSLPAMATQTSAAQQQRSRSYSTPDINGPGGPRQRHPSQNNVPTVPSIPQHLHSAHDSSIPRSQTGSPRNDLPVRTNTQSPGAHRGHHHQHSGSVGGTMSHFPAQPLVSRGNTPNPPNGANPLRIDSVSANSRTVSPALGTSTLPAPTSTPNHMASSDIPFPSQLKVKVNCDSGNYVTLVVAFNITYQSLIDRIDAKLARFTSSSIGKGALKLRYRDEDGDLVTIQSDDDIQIAFMDWREGVKNLYSAGVGEIDLYCVGELIAA